MPAAAAIGSTVNVVIRVHNKRKVRASRSRLKLYLTKGDSYRRSRKQLLKQAKLRAVPGRTMVRQRVGFRIPASTLPSFYRLVACADATNRVVESKERDNCRASRKLMLTAPTPPPAVPKPEGPAPAFTVTDDVDWGLNQNSDLEFASESQPVVTTLRAANGLPGQAGYAYSKAGGHPFATGNATALTFNDEDDGSARVALPFAFPFGGIYEDSVSVSTNGWLGFGTSPALDRFPDTQRTDYRGPSTVVGDLYRGVMPFWSDLTTSDAETQVRMVTPVDKSFVAFQWEVKEAGSEIPRSFQAVLFPDGSFRFDYPGTNPSGDIEGFVGYSLGTGPSSVGIVGDHLRSVPAASIMFVPDALPAASSLGSGNATLTLPPGSSLTSADPGCTLSQAPTATGAGLVTCTTAPLPVGRQETWLVHFTMPPNAPNEAEPANFRYKGQFVSGASTLSDTDEIDALSRDLRPATIGITPQFRDGPPRGGVPMIFEPIIKSFEGGLAEPIATFAFTHATISSIKIGGLPIDCTYSGDDTSTACALPSGVTLTEVEIIVVPVSTTTVEFKATAQALNAPPVTEGLGVSP